MVRAADKCLLLRKILRNPSKIGSKARAKTREKMIAEKKGEKSQKNPTMRAASKTQKTDFSTYSERKVGIVNREIIGLCLKILK